MKYAIICFCLFLNLTFFAQESSNSIKFNDAKKEQLYGNIKEIQEYIYTANFDRHVAEKGQFVSGKYKIFSINGDILESGLLDSDVDKSVTQRTIFKYENGLKLSNETSDMYGGIISKQEFSHNKSGFCTETTYTNSMGALISKIQYEYGDNWIKTNELFADKWNATTLFTYKKGKLSKIKTHGKDGDIETNYNLNELGYPIKSVTIKDKNRTVRTYTYVNDEKGNWTKRIEYINDIPQNFTIRSITYF